MIEEIKVEMVDELEPVKMDEDEEAEKAIEPEQEVNAEEIKSPIII